MGKYIYNERSEMKRIMEEGFYNDTPTYRELSILAKMFRQEFGYGEIGIYKALVRFLHDRLFENIYFLDGILISVSRKAVRISDYREVTYPIPIYEDDIDSIRKIKNFNYQKIVFSAIVFARSYGNASIFSENLNIIRHISDISGVRASTSEIERNVFSSAYIAGVFEYIFRKGSVSGFYRLFDKEDSPLVFSIDNEVAYLNAGKVYEAYIGGEIKWCEGIDCDDEFLRSGNNNRFCPSCSDIIKKEKATERKRRQRDV